MTSASAQTGCLGHRGGYDRASNAQRKAAKRLGLCLISEGRQVAPQIVGPVFFDRGVEVWEMPFDAEEAFASVHRVSTNDDFHERRSSDAMTPFRAQARARSSGSLRTGARQSWAGIPTPPSYQESRSVNGRSAVPRRGDPSSPSRSRKASNW